MTVSRLSLYNGALLDVGERRLASLTEDRKPRHDLDFFWDNGAVRYCLEQGSWAFATRTSEWTYDPGIDPEFGFRHGFVKPDDFVRLIAISTSEYFDPPLNRYRPETDRIYCDEETIFVRHCSDDAAYGMDFSLWPQTFVEFVQAYLAFKISPSIKNLTDIDRVKANWTQKLLDAQSKDAIQEPTSFPPMGSWASSRLGGSRRYRGER
jgi:hypothetical protein